MPDRTFADFEAEQHAAGFPTVVTREWSPNCAVDTHAHPFDASALIVRGEMWLTVHGATRHLRPGDTFEIPAGLEHQERYGPEGAAYWVARR